MSSPPADPPMQPMRSGSTHPEAATNRVASTKSVNVFFLCSFLPWSYQDRPSSPPPRTWATTYTTPRSSSDRRDAANPGSMDAS